MPISGEIQCKPKTSHQQSISDFYFISRSYQTVHYVCFNEYFKIERTWKWHLKFSYDYLTLKYKKPHFQLCIHEQNVVLISTNRILKKNQTKALKINDIK